MTLESDLFKRKWPLFDKLENFGFIKQNKEYKYTETLASDKMRAEVIVHDTGAVEGRVIDPFTEEEYVAVHTNTPKGSYAAQIRSEYLRVLERICASCFKDVPFISAQMNRIAKYIEEKYHCSLSHPFKKDKESSVYCHPEGKKWFALIQEIDYAKIDAAQSGLVEILTLKKGAHFINQDGIYPAWHMNHAQWISIVMTDTLKDEKIEKLVTDSFDATKPALAEDRIAGHWIIPANPAYFDVDHAFHQKDTLFWKQSTHIEKGDLIFMYYGSPFSQLRYLCQVIETDIPYESFYEGPVKIEKEMRIKKLYFFADNILNRKLLADYGVKYVRGPLHMPAVLEKKILELYPGVKQYIEMEKNNG